MTKSLKVAWRDISVWQRIIIRWLYPQIFDLFKRLARFERQVAGMESRIKGLVLAGREKDEQVKRLRKENLKYRELSEKDPKTTLLNTRGLESQFVNSIEITQRSRTSEPVKISLIIIDIDNFKKVNDEVGHDHGDTALLIVTELMQICFPRKTDLKCRWGGDEFVVILYESDMAYASNAAERFRKSVESDARLEFETPAGDKIRVTVSIGVTERVIHSDEHGVLNTLLSAEIGRTDAALREAKKSGKNQVRIIENQA